MRARVFRGLLRLEHDVLASEAANALERVARGALADRKHRYDAPDAENEAVFDMLDSGGMGLGLIRQSAASMQYERRDGQNIFTVCFSLSSPSDMSPSDPSE